MKLRYLLALMTLSIPGCVSAQTGFLNRTVTLNDTIYRYVVYLPPSWTPDRKWPVILFLHGSVETGDDGLKQSYVGLARENRRHPERFPAIVVMPQCRENNSWESLPMQQQALAALDGATQEFGGDPQRTYLTGFSMGGYGTWSMAARNPQRFAALVVVSGGILFPPSVAKRPLKPGADNPYARTAQAVSRIPVWIFHGDSDHNVPVTESRRMAAALTALKANIHYTEYKGVDHFSCQDHAYAEPELPSWLFAQHLHGDTETN